MNAQSLATENEKCTLSMRVIPRAKRNQVIGFMPDGRLKIKIKSPPVDGKANESLRKYLAEILGQIRGQLKY